ncbi:hypothetical protein DEO72_LG2g3278 [Vigna unguiculata]|uniref:Uncharacterized protein n=1 Tax=Vigna unguiculata TaxID=3917 RepID=A0A4D6L386_VIGUN|nr:hypothetical protein DEO72_LG2g3278 [Vigna unguiculata]
MIKDHRSDFNKEFYKSIRSELRIEWNCMMIDGLPPSLLTSMVEDDEEWRESNEKNLQVEEECCMRQQDCCRWSEVEFPCG